jgi:hypothetical protein
VKPHFGHLYKRPNLRHFPSRLIWISPQLGQRNFVDSLPGGIGLPQLVQVTKDSVVALSVIINISSLLIVGLPYICYAYHLKIIHQFLAFFLN